MLRRRSYDERERKINDAPRDPYRRFFDPLAAMNLELTVASLIGVFAMLGVMTWGAAQLTMWFESGERAALPPQDVAVAMYRLGQGQLMVWDGVWPTAVQQAMPDSTVFWLSFVAEAFAFAALFWLLWRLLGPRVPDPMAVWVFPTPHMHPRRAARQAEQEAQVRRLESSLGGGGGSGEGSLPAPVAPPGIDDLIVDEPNGHRVVLGELSGQLVAAKPNHSIVVLGPDKREKADGLIVPAVARWEGPVVVSSSDPLVLSQIWAARQQRRGQSWLFDPTGSSRVTEPRGHEETTRRVAVETSGWSPLRTIGAFGAPSLSRQQNQEIHNKQWSAARNVAQWLIAAVAPPRLLGESDPMIVAAEQMLAPMLFVAAAKGQPIRDVVDWVQSAATDHIGEELRRLGAPLAAGAWRSAMSQSGDVQAESRQLLGAALYPYGDPEVAEFAEYRQIDTERLFDGADSSLLVAAPITQQDRLKPLLTAIVAEVVDLAINRALANEDGVLDPPLLLVLDDAVAFAPLAAVEHLAATGSRLGIQLVTGFNDLGEAERLAGSFRSAKHLVNTHQTKVVLAGIGDSETLDYVGGMLKGSPLLGADNPQAKAMARHLGGDGTSAVVMGGAGWLRTLGNSHAVVIPDNLSASLVELVPWRRDPALRRQIAPDEEGGHSGRKQWLWNLLARIRGPKDDLGDPSPFNSAANDREAQRYWESVRDSSQLPD